MLAESSDGVSGATEELCQKLVHAAEAHSPIRVLHQLFAHQSMSEPARHCRYAHVVIFVLGSWCKAFKLQISTLPYEAVQDVLSLLDDIFRDNSELTRCVCLSLLYKRHKQHKLQASTDSDVVHNATNYMSQASDSSP